MELVKWGIVSTGRIAKQFCEDLTHTSNGQAYGVAARRLEDAAAFADAYQVQQAYAGYQAMFDDPNIDVVYIATPHNFHFEQVKAALLAGKHVLCEKPATTNPQDWSALTLLAKQQQCLLMEAMWTYFLPAMQQAKQWLAEGKVGEVKHIKVDFGYPMPFEPNGREYNPDLAGGCLLDMGIYPLAIAHYFLEQDIELKYVNANVLANGVEDDVVIFAQCNKINVSLATSFQCRLKNAAYIIGDKGYIEIPDAFRAYQCHRFELDELMETYTDKRESLGYHFEAQEMGQLIQEGKTESAVVTHQHSLLFQQQLARIREQF